MNTQKRRPKPAPQRFIAGECSTLAPLPPDDLNLATEAFSRAAADAGLPEDWTVLDRVVRLGGWNPDALTAAEWTMLALVLEEVGHDAR